eukprot:CAMPEP_0197665324 /NCGR_PEP_ID=MMETSP1338-20131121/59156_1 /TAXON_ID=43686 ORGANISM="Pelagodinium beii, Strain RCC1491" /NCGR_SAMPLE_ID=MMETSP1338 /ASSEMBLY_ACC=CAM_ASM_000754 /LENGTH=425 /DNA_ID=CAMNT_0043244105 /DNA_START=37 /DNA_END=1314 /DNA_ORIENTATION=+
MAQDAVTSQILQYQRSGRWRIEGAGCLSLKPNAYIESDTLFDIPEGPRFVLRLYIGGYNPPEQPVPLIPSEYASVFAACKGYGSLKTPMMWTARIVCTNQADENRNFAQGSLAELWKGMELTAKTPEHFQLGQPQFIERSKLASDGFIVNGTLLFQLEAKIWFPDVRSSQVPAGEPFAAAALAFSGDLARLLKSRAGSDVVLRAGVQNGGETSPEPIPAHRSLLAARSPVFQQMFFGATGMAEAAACSEVCLSDMDHPTASLFLEFLYTGKVEAKSWADDDAVCHLLVAGHKYEVNSLVEACVSRLTSSLNEENAAELLMMADLLGITQIRDAALEYMCASTARLAAIQSTEAFDRLGQQRPQLALQIMKKLVVPAKRPAESHDLPEDLSSKTVVQLKQLCSDRGLPTSGNKQALIDRLKASRGE